MPEMTLTQIEVSRIQDYIFGSNNLKQNIGASELVTKATTDWVQCALVEEKITHNIDDTTIIDKLVLAPWAADFLQAQIIYWGGGNALILFKGSPIEYAIPFAKNLTRKLIKQARGLSLVVGHQSFNWEKESVADKHNTLRTNVAARKLNRIHNSPLLGLSVTADCAFTGLPATGINVDNNRISQAVQHKYAAHKVEKRLVNMLDSVSRYPFADDFNLLGERNESSYIAVIHADGNGMGDRFQEVAKAHLKPEENHAYCRQLRQLSQAVAKKAEEALKDTVQLLVNSIDPKNDKFGGVVPIPENEEGNKFLPFRPIVFGGDDVTFVSEGRLGLALAIHYLKKIGEGSLPGTKDGEDGEPLYARAGVAIVKNHYPFSRAYELAEALCASAKHHLPDLTPQEKGMVLDWHFATSGVILSLESLREQEYRSRGGRSLLMRPIRLDLEAPLVESKYWRSWHNFMTVTREMQESGDWDHRRNKVKGLREPLRDGGQSVRQFRNKYDLPLLPKIPGQSTIMRETGWHGQDCGYFDAIEAIDFYVHLEDRSLSNDKGGNA